MANPLGHYIKARREGLKMTQDDLIRRLGREDRSMISKLESGVIKRPDYALLVQIATALGEDVDTLIEGAGLKDAYASEMPPSELSPAAERLIAFTKTHLAGIDDAEGDRLIRIMAAGFASKPPD